jgi:hypothetical protein
MVISFLQLLVGIQDTSEEDQSETAEDSPRPAEPVLYRNILGTRVGLAVPEEELPW